MSINRTVFDEVNKKIGNLQQKFSIEMNWKNKKSEIFEFHTDNWQSANTIANGAKVKAIEDINDTTNSSSIIYHAPKDSIIDSHSHPQIELCICLSGKLTLLTEDGNEYLLEPIKSVYISPNKFHSIKFNEESQILLTWFPKVKI